MNTPVATLMLVGSWLIFSFWGVIARTITLPVPLMLLSICIGGAIFSIFFIRRPLIFSWVAVIVAAILILDLLFLFLAFQRISFATTIAIHYAGPIVVSILAPIILGEKFSIKGLSFSIIGFVAVLILCGVELRASSQQEAIYGIAFAIISAFTLAGNVIFQRLYMTQQPFYGNAVAQYNLFMAIGYLFMIPFWPFLSGQSVLPLAPNAAIQLSIALGAGLMTQGLAMILFNSAIRYIDSQSVSRMSFSEVVMTILLGAAIYGENVSAVQIAAILLIIGVVYLSQRSDAKNSRATSKAANQLKRAQ